MNYFGLVRVTVCSPEVTIGNPLANLSAIYKQLDACEYSNVVVFPELSITGYTCADLFKQQTLLDASNRALFELRDFLSDDDRLVFVGAPIRVSGELFNCAVAIQNGRVIGVVPKQHIPNYSEFYEKRWFKAAGIDPLPKEVLCGDQMVPFGIDLLFCAGDHSELVIFAEICEDLFMPIPPSSIACLHGATLLVNLSASPETVAKSEYRMELVKNQSGRCVAAYAYASAGPSESTTDLVFSGHCIIAENDTILAESTHIGDGKLDFVARMVTADVDIAKCATARQSQDTFGDCRRYVDRTYRAVVFFGAFQVVHPLLRHIPSTPFVPTNPATLSARCAAVFDIQVGALYRRLKHLNFPPLSLGVSGGLDSTHALIVTHQMLLKAGMSPEKLVCKTMPGFGTTNQTKNIACRLMEETGVISQTIDIREMCLLAFQQLNHSPFGINLESLHTAEDTGNILRTNDEIVDELTKRLQNLPLDNRSDLVFENVQARIRTFLLMSDGFVIGTGDMSELALGWATYCGDHMSMYGLNAGVPKTLIKFLVSYVAEHHYGGALKRALLDCTGLTVSPELLPTNEKGEILQSTESIVGPYELNDFFLFNMIRQGFSPKKVLYLACQSDLGLRYSEQQIKKALKNFIRRFFSQQFKRSCLPDGPKVGTLSLSPRGDWRCPSDASAEAWLNTIE
jgi:NAD+ synthase (glutamine-hydrolysing)